MNPTCIIRESQRDSVPKPRVAEPTRGYPGIRVVIRHNPDGVASILAPRAAATPLGLRSFSPRFPRVAG